MLTNQHAARPVRYSPLASVCRAGHGDRGAKTKTSKGQLAGSRSNEISSGGPEGIRTPDLYSAIVALSQLSYRPEDSRIVAVCTTSVKVKFLVKHSQDGVRQSGSDDFIAAS